MSSVFDYCREEFTKRVGRKPSARELSAEVSAFYDEPGDFDMTNYVPPGPQARGFINSDMLAPFIMGPVGGGKTAACVMKRIRAATMMPTGLDGWKRCYWIVVRDTYRSAQKTVLQSWMEWFPKGYAGSSWEGGNDRPAVHTLRFELPATGEKVEAITEFLGLNGETIEARTKGRQLSGAWLNEATDIGKDAVSYLQSQRIGRYPKLDTLPEGAKRYKQLIGDFNAPDLDNWTYEDLHENPTEGRILFSQKGGLHELAENTQALDGDYYTNIIANEEDWYVRRFVHNQFGYSRHGLPVYFDVFDNDIHVAKEQLQFDPDLPVIIGADGGLTPASIFMQPQPNGQIRRIREIVPGHGYDAYTHGQLIRNLLELECSNVKDVRGYIDPASAFGGGKALGTELEMISQGSGIPFAIPGDGNNNPQVRLAAMRKEFSGRINKDTPQALYCPSMKITNRGNASGYRFKKRPEGAGSKYEPLPEKNDYSHPCDADQYGTIGYRSAPGYFGQTTGWASQQASGTSNPSSPWAAKNKPWSPHKVGVC